MCQFIQIKNTNISSAVISVHKCTEIKMCIKSSCAISHVNWLNITDISGTIPVPIIRV